MMLRTLILVALPVFLMGAPAPKTTGSDDGVIEANIRAKFAKSKIAEEHFKVSVRSGVALIEGKTAVPQRKGVATRLAKTGGAREVVNKIEISDAARKQMTDRLQKARDQKPGVSKKKVEAEPDPPAVTPPQAVAPPPTSTGAQPLRRMQIKH